MSGNFCRLSRDFPQNPLENSQLGCVRSEFVENSNQFAKKTINEIRLTNSTGRDRLLRRGPHTFSQTPSRRKTGTFPVSDRFRLPGLNRCINSECSKIFDAISVSLVQRAIIDYCFWLNGLATNKLQNINYHASKLHTITNAFPGKMSYHFTQIKTIQIEREIHAVRMNYSHNL